MQKYNWTMQECEECGGIGEIETEIFNSQPPDWRVIDCYECEGVGETMQPNEEGDNDE